jgi:uncharacterized protein (TIGR02588 family)
MAEEESKDNSAKPEDKSADKKGNQSQTREKSAWEWIIAVIGLILVAGAIGVVLRRAATEEASPPNLKVSVESIQPSGDGFLVKYLVRNTGNQTAAAVTIEGELKKGEKSEETGTATLNYAPAHSERPGGLFFTKNPDQFQLEVRATGYVEP